MADGVVVVREPPLPDGYSDHGLSGSNSVGGVVYRQRVEDPELMASLRQLRDALVQINSCITRENGPAAVPALRVTSMGSPGPLISAFEIRNQVSNPTVLAVERFDMIPTTSGGPGFPMSDWVDFLASALGPLVAVT